MIDFVDSQVNYGKSVFGPDCDLDYYDIKAREIGITRALVMPTITHELKISNLIERSCIWEKENDHITYTLHILRGNNWEIKPAKSNPYSLMNFHTLEKIRELNRNSQIKYYFLPKVHPFLDTKEELERLLNEEETVGIKINGLATHTSPKDMPEWIVKIANEYDVVIFVHTDFLNPNLEDNRTPDYLKHIIHSNCPIGWLKWAQQYSPKKIYFAHLARMDDNVAREIYNLENISIGIGPDIMLQDEPIRLKNSTNNILNDALKIFNFKQLMYSTDFAWNVFDRREWGNFDWETHQRLKKEALALNLSEYQLYRILGQNAIDFFQLDKHNVKC